MNEVLICLDVSDCALYPILKRLEKEKCVKSYSVEIDGRLRKYYSITPEGCKKLNGANSDWESLNKIYGKILGGDVSDKK